MSKCHIRSMQHRNKNVIQIVQDLRFHSGDHEDSILLGYDPMQTDVYAPEFCCPHLQGSPRRVSTVSSQLIPEVDCTVCQKTQNLKHMLQLILGS